MLKLASAFNGRRLCENTVGLYEQRGIADWRSADAVDQTEWVNQIRTVSTCCSNSRYYIQESLHPNALGQIALGACLRQAIADTEDDEWQCRAGAGVAPADVRLVPIRRKPIKAEPQRKDVRDIAPEPDNWASIDEGDIAAAIVQRGGPAPEPLTPAG